MLKQNDKVTYTAQAYANSETVGVVDDCTVFVPQMIVGEKATVKINHVKRNVAYGSVVEMLQASPKRVAPTCNSFGKCGGCALMHMDYAEQLEFKKSKVQNNLRKIGGIDVEVLPCMPSSKVTGYRNKLSLPVSGVKGNVKIGMYERQSHKVVDTGDCHLGGDWTVKLIELFRKYCNEQCIVPYDESNFTGEVRHLVARCVSGQLLVTVVANGAFKRNLQPFADMLSAHFDKFGLFINVNTNKNNVILGKTTQHFCGLKYIEGEHLGVKFRLRPNSFFQVNDNVADAIYTKVKELLDVSNTQVLVDCFSGIGILTCTLASDRYDTYAIEIEPSAVKDAKEMVGLNNSPRVHNLCGDVAVELPKIVAKHTGEVLTVVVDPPRKGLGETVCNTLLQANVNNVVYVSCDSATLARDLTLLSTKYIVTYAQPWDMFPNTDQVETVVLLERK